MADAAAEPKPEEPKAATVSTEGAAEGGGEEEPKKVTASSRFRIPKKAPSAVPPASAPPATFATNSEPELPPPPPPPPLPPPPLPPLPHPPSNFIGRGGDSHVPRGVSIPEGWRESSSGGASIHGMCPVKTPLSTAYDTQLLPEQRWTPALCITACGGANVRLVIDLTATERYYSPAELGQGVRHLKVATHGRDVPTEEQMEEIYAALRQLTDAGAPAEPAIDTAEQASSSLAIVHCTHGLNRTGYVVVRALCDVHGYNLVDALGMFAAIRPPGLWREEYLRALQAKLGGPMPALPVPPEWARVGPHERRDGRGRQQRGGDSSGAGGAGDAGGAGGAGEDVFAGALQRDEGGSFTYFQDRRRRWPYRTDAKGAGLLRAMIGTAAPLLEGMIKALELTEPEMRADGEKIYAQKPNLGEHGITWSQENYAHKGLQIEYLRLKSIQRFTESYVCMQRAYNAGAFAKLQRSTADGAATGSIPYSIVSLGGGPGFELLGAKAFCDEYLPAAAVTLKSLDLEASWRPCAEGLGLAFGEWDVNDGDGLMAASGVDRIDLALISYVYYHYMSTSLCAEWLAKRLRDGSIGAVLIICRFENHGRNISMMEELGVRTTKLMRQPRFSSRASDDRQLLYTSADDPAPEPLPAEEQLEMSYPNVPHEDQKDPRDRSYSSSAPIDGGGVERRRGEPSQGRFEPPPWEQQRGGGRRHWVDGRDDWHRGGGGGGGGGGGPDRRRDRNRGHGGKGSHPYHHHPDPPHASPYPYGYHGPPPPAPHGVAPGAGPYPQPLGLPPPPSQLARFYPPPPPSTGQAIRAPPPPSGPRPQPLRPIAFVSASMAMAVEGEGGAAEIGADKSAAAPPEDPEARRDRRLGQVPDALRDALRAVEPHLAEPALAFFCLDGGHSGARELVLEADGDMHEIVLKLDFEAKAWKRVRRKVKPS